MCFFFFFFFNFFIDVVSSPAVSCPFSQPQETSYKDGKEIRNLVLRLILFATLVIVWGQNLNVLRLRRIGSCFLKSARLGNSSHAKPPVDTRGQSGHSFCLWVDSSWPALCKLAFLWTFSSKQELKRENARTPPRYLEVLRPAFWVCTGVA